MSFLNADEVHGALLHSVQRPTRFDDWLTGAHYTKKYLPQLEHTREAVKEFLIVGQSSASERLSSSLISSRNRQNGRNKVIDCEADKPSSGLVKETNFNNPQEICSNTTSNAQHHNEEFNFSNYSTSMQNKESRLQRKDKKRCGKEKVEKHVVEAGQKSLASKLMYNSGNNLDASEVRNQLKDSYFHMRDADAFGDTFPPLLTPYNRPLFKYYLKEEWDDYLRELGTINTSYQCAKNEKQMETKPYSVNRKQNRRTVYPEGFESSRTIAHFNNSMHHTGPPHFVATLHCHIKKMNYV